VCGKPCYKAYHCKCRKHNSKLANIKANLIEEDDRKDNDVIVAVISK